MVFRRCWSHRAVQEEGLPRREAPARKKSPHLPSILVELRRRVALEGIAAAKHAGLHIKLNTVALKGVNDSEFDDLIRWSGEHGFDLALIEVMPMGELGSDARVEQYLPLSIVRAQLQRRWTLEETDYRTGGPARYYVIRETGCRLGLITPLTHNFCESCNRVRLTCTVLCDSKRQ
jgi:GTP 3',8-cyclase